MRNFNFSNEFINRFWDSCKRDPITNCWLWTKSTTPNGYGKVKYEGKTYGTHRLAYIISRGEHPGNYSVLHTCDTKLCINPEHLYKGTQGDNMRDRSIRNRYTPVGDKKLFYCGEVWLMRRLYAANISLRTIAKIFMTSGHTAKRTIMEDRTCLEII